MYHFEIAANIYNKFITHLSNIIIIEFKFGKDEV